MDLKPVEKFLDRFARWANLSKFEKFLDPYRVILLSLIILILINANLQGFNDAILSSITALLVSVITDTTITYIKTRNRFEEGAVITKPPPNIKIEFKWYKLPPLLKLSYGPAISGLILALVFSPNLPLYNIAGTAALAQALKHIIRYKNNNIFNPASLAMILVFLYVPAEAWWGNKIPEALILGLIVSWRIKRLPASITFMVAYTVFSMIAGSLQANSQDTRFSSQVNEFPQELNLVEPIATYIDLSTAWVFFAFFMLVEPRTSPRAFKAQIIYSALVALIAVLGFSYSLHSPILLALLIGNVATAFYLGKIK